MEFEGATYHVMCRGDRRENIFEDDLDRARFLETLGEGKGPFRWTFLGFSIDFFAGSSQRLACVLLQFSFNGVVETPLLTKSSPDRRLGARDDGLR